MARDHGEEIAAQLRRIADFFDWQREEVEETKAQQKAWSEQAQREAEMRRQVEEAIPSPPDPSEEMIRLSLKMLRKAAGEDFGDD